MKAALRIALVLLLAAAVEAAAQTGNFTSTYVARWNLTHGKYLVDIGQYLEALEAFNTAIEMTDDVEIRTDALLQKANALAVFLDAPDDAIRVYDDLLKQYSQSAAAESALFRAAMVLFDRGQYARAATYFDRYLKEYPGGPSHGSAEFLLGQSRSKVPATPAPVAPPSITQVRVRVFKGHGSLRVESDGALTLTPAVGSGHGVDLSGRGGLVVAGTEKGVREVAVGADKPLLVRADHTTRHYHGGLTVRADGDSLQIINRVGMEEYLYGVVTKESAASWPLEALKAQAIASRTYALYQVEHRRDRDYDMVDDEGSQVYGGIEGESASGRRAVDETRGMIVAYRGRPIYAMFTSNTGWYTADPAFIFDQPLPYLIAQPDAYSPGEQMGRWKRSFSTGEIRRKLSDIGVQLGAIQAIEPRVTCRSGRIVRMDIRDDHGSHVMRTRPTLGRALNLPEILVAIEKSGDQFVFAGGGFGHGVGLSQWGAKAMATKGLSVKDILAFYYHGAEITALPQ